MSGQGRRAAAGAIGAAAALSVAELLGAVLAGAPSPVTAVGQLVVDHQPPGAKSVAVAVFGTHDKAALDVAVGLLAVAVGAGAGLLARRAAAAAVFAVFAAFGLFAQVRDPSAAAPASLATVTAAAVAGFAVMAWLLRVAAPRRDLPAAGWSTAEPGPPPPPEPADAASGGPSPAPPPTPTDRSPPDGSRRRFLAAAGGAGLAAAAGFAAGRWTTLRREAAPTPTVAIPPAADPVAPPPPAAALDVAGVTPVVVPNEDFYRIDVNLRVPRIDPGAWRLRVHGMVDREIVLGYEDLLALGIVERYVTIACVSNEVGGDLVGNAAWGGVPLTDVLDLAGVRPGATQVVGRAFDGWTAGFPTEYALADGTEALVAVTMNGEPLPPRHGYPARLVVGGLYGYVSATKWLTEIELTTMEAFDAYWVPLGWAKQAPVKTQSRIDVPRPDARIPPGAAVAAGVAWAPGRGVAKVEVSVDGGPWQEARLSQPLSEESWVQWRLDWDAAPGDHLLAVRATDGAGDTQSSERRPPRPDGATGHHTVRVRVG